MRWRNYYGSAQEDIYHACIETKIGTGGHLDSYVTNYHSLPAIWRTTTMQSNTFPVQIDVQDLFMATWQYQLAVFECTSTERIVELPNRCHSKIYGMLAKLALQRCGMKSPLVPHAVHLIWLTGRYRLRNFRISIFQSWSPVMAVRAWICYCGQWSKWCIWLDGIDVPDYIHYHSEVRARQDMVNRKTETLISPYRSVSPLKVVTNTALPLYRSHHAESDTNWKALFQVHWWPYDERWLIGISTTLSVNPLFPICYKTQYIRPLPNHPVPCVPELEQKVQKSVQVHRFYTTTTFIIGTVAGARAQIVQNLLWYGSIWKRVYTYPCKRVEI